MNILQAIILGIVQGLVEWLPLSSKGITTLIMVNFFNLTFSEAFVLSIWLHVGTLLAAIVYFWRELIDILLQLPSYRPGKEKFSLINFLIAGTIVTGIVGGSIFILGIDKLNIPAWLATLFIGIALLITGAILLLTHKKVREHKEIHWIDGIWVGLAQGFAIIPGISRSGTTLGALVARKYEAEQALRLSFLLSIPVVLLAEIGLGLIKGVHFEPVFLVAIGLAFVFGLLSMSALFKLVKKVNFGLFALGLGLLCIASVLIRG